MINDLKKQRKDHLIDSELLSDVTLKYHAIALHLLPRAIA
jgi:hypothetical protein